MKTYKINIFKHETKKGNTKQTAKEKEKKPYLKKKMRFVFFFQTSNLYLFTIYNFTSVWDQRVH